MRDQKTAPSGLKVFVVENHNSTRTVMEAWLKTLGHQVQTATCVREALTAMPEAGMDVIISDLNLPDGTGWDIMQQVDLPALPYAVAMSGHGFPEAERKSRANGFRHYLQKPFDPERLVHCLKEAQAERDARSAA